MIEKKTNAPIDICQGLGYNTRMKNETMTVYMAALGENYEGVGPTSLHYTLEGAVEQAKKWISESTFEWKRTTPYGTQLRAWAGGCDYIEITEKKILK